MAFVIGVKTLNIDTVLLTNTANGIDANPVAQVVMVVAPPFTRAVALQNVFCNVMLPMAVASAFALSALPNSALAQIESKPVAETCFPLRAKFAFSGPMEPTKATAILGGATSKLDQIRSVQNSGQLVTINMTQTLQTTSECTHGGQNLAALDVTAPFKDTLLGAQSIRIARTPFDGDWAAIQRRPNNIRIQLALTKSGARGSADKAKQIQMVNLWVNKNIAFGDDQAVYGRADYWAPSSETLRRGIGDCEDLAIAKMDMLAALGVARADMRLIIARDLVRNADHAVLVVSLNGGAVMLDNVTDRLLDGQMSNDYRPIMSFSQNAKWVHGYGVQQPATIRLASLPALATPVYSEPPDVVTVTIEPEMPEMSIAILSTPLVPPTLL